MTATPDDFDDELRRRLREQAAECLRRRQERSAARKAFNAARKAGKTRHHKDVLANRAGKNKENHMTTTTEWRTYTGAEYYDVRQIPCYVIANGFLLDSAGDPIHEDHPELSAEIDRRDRSVYRDHGHGEGHPATGWGNIPVTNCVHMPNGGE